MKCRACKTTLEITFADLDFSPPSNAYLSVEDFLEPEVHFPLRVMVCKNCFLVQLDEFARHDDIFNDQYAYFSSYSSSWLEHAQAYSKMMINRFGFDSSSQVVEIASNDGYLLQYFKTAGIPVLGVEPTANTAAAAKEKGIDSVIDFFGTRLAKQMREEGKKADLLLGNNVLAHVPDINDFVQGMNILLNNDGIITMEFPHLTKLIQYNQFDTIYHEHYSYLSLHSVKFVFEQNGLRIFDVEEIPTHGGSLRIFACHKEAKYNREKRVDQLLTNEKQAGVLDITYYSGFQNRIDRIKLSLLEFLITQKKAGKKVMGYGAAAKGNTLLNFSGVSKDLILSVADKNPHKQNKFLPGSHIPVVSPDDIETEKPDYIIIFPWNIKEEVMKQLNYVSKWNAKFVVFIPETIILND
jgi:SAM-dependent methyltransferase